MANEKFKFRGINANGDVKVLRTENHPKLDSTDDDKRGALNALSGFFEITPLDVVLTSETTVYTAN